MKSRRILLLLLSVLLCLSLLTGRAGTLSAEQQKPLPVRPGWIVVLKEDETPEGLIPIPHAEGYYTADSTLNLLPLMLEGKIEQCTQDAQLELLSDPGPDDPDLDRQWYLTALGADRAWQESLTGVGVRVAVIDSGVNYTHEDLASAALTGLNFLGPEESRDETAYRDDVGHGSLVCGILAAGLNNSLGGAGICPETEVLALRCFSGVGGTANSGSGSAATVISAIGYAMEHGADVINLSIGGTSSSLQSMEPILQQAADQGILLIAACGNRGSTTLYYPAAFDCVTGVGWTDETGGVSSSSQRNASVYVTAPGTNIYGPGHRRDDAYQIDSGGSFAAPMVTAMAVMVKQTDPAIGTEGFRYLLRQIAEDQGDPGRDDAYGFGSVRIDDLVEDLSRPQEILYETKGGSLIPGNYDESYRIGRGEDVILPDAAQIRLEGFRFTGWYLDSEASVPAAGIPAGSVGPVSLYAGWEEAPPEETTLPHGPEDPCPGAVFSDMPPYGNWAHDPIDWAVLREITSGTDASHFSPKRECTRAQALTFLWRAFGSPETEAVPAFSDVPRNAWYAKAVAWAVESGVTKGKDKTHFKPGDPCTRAQAMTFLWNAMGKPEPGGEGNPFTDVKPGRFYYKAVLWAVENGITKGMSANVFGVDRISTRAHVVTFLYNTLAEAGS